ncbi:hypothetical protein ANO11243_052190 [Dothideomycetidae sp. 11243]|nr:hypothetical protein ANO11243_052190 [fungal sp. No.11243]
MSFYDAQPWAAAQGRQPTWDQQKPASRSEVERAIDNLTKSGKIFPGGPGPHMGPARRDSFPVHGRGYTEIESRSGGPSRHQSVSEYDGGRPNSSVGLQGYYASQRFQQRQQPDQDQMLQAKRRMAAQRERELRNYHQEQQYNRSE